MIQDFLESCYPGVDLKETAKFEILMPEDDSQAVKVKFTNAVDATEIKGYFHHTSMEAILFLP